jgi:transposase
MPKTKPPYPAAFKRQIVELAMAGRTPAELSREFGDSGQSVTAWVARAAAEAGKPARGKDTLDTPALPSASAARGWAIRSGGARKVSRFLGISAGWMPAYADGRDESA